MARRDSAFPAVFRRLRAGQTPGDPRVQGSARSTRCPCTPVGEPGGARGDTGVLVRSTIGRMAVRWSRPMEGTPTTVTVSSAAHGWEVGCACADGPTQPLAATGPQTGIDVGVEAFAPLANGTLLPHPRG